MKMPKSAKKVHASSFPIDGLSSSLSLLFKPERAQYVKKSKVGPCVFCQAARKNELSFSTLCVYKSPKSLVLLNKFPYNSGHILILPKAHKAQLNELTLEEYQDLCAVLRLGEQVLQDVYKPQGMNIGLNLGAAAGAGIPDHLHFHLIPRWRGDLNFFPLVGKSKVLIETLEDTYKKLKTAFKRY